jgi:hypothetical protein
VRAVARTTFVVTGWSREYNVKYLSRSPGLWETQDFRNDWKVWREFIPAPSVLNVLNFSKKATVIPRMTSPATAAYVVPESTPRKADASRNVVRGCIAAMQRLLAVLGMKAPLITSSSKAHARKVPTRNSLMLG